MTRLDLQIRTKALREELENRYKLGTVKMARDDGNPIPTKNLQDEMYALIYKMSKLDKSDS
jgi:hypothetical protein